MLAGGTNVIHLALCCVVVEGQAQLCCHELRSVHCVWLGGRARWFVVWPAWPERVLEEERERLQVCCAAHLPAVLRFAHRQAAGGSWQAVGSTCLPLALTADAAAAVAADLSGCTVHIQAIEPASSEFNVTRNYLDW